VVYAPIDISKQKELTVIMASNLEAVQNNNTYADFQNALNEGLKAIDKLLEAPLNAIQTVQNFLDLPSTYEQAIKGRVAAYESIYWRLKDSIETLADKKYYEGMAGTILSLISVTITNPIAGDYITISDLKEMVDKISSLYYDYQQTLDNLSVSVYDVTNSFSPDALAQTELNNLINYTIANLYQLSFGARRERIVVLGKDTNLIILVHRYLGLDDDDENIQIFKKTNNITFNELFQLKKGREVKYIK